VLERRGATWDGGPHAVLVRLVVPGLEAHLSHQTELIMSVARVHMSPLQHNSRPSLLDGKRIAQVVAAYYHLSFEQMCGKQRDKHIVLPRQIAMYLIRQETQVSLSEIGQLFGGRDHTTVLHAWQKIDRTLPTNSTLQSDIAAIRERLHHSSNH
jgi:chromosomal replication initiator protein